MLPACFRYRTQEEIDSYMGTYEYYSLVAMTKVANLPLRAWQNLSLGVSKEDVDAYNSCNEYKRNVVTRVNNGLGLYIYGGVGSGKTIWAYKIARQYMEIIASTWDEDRDQTPVYFANVPRLLDDLRGAFKDDALMRKLDKLMMESDLVIFDDLGAENATEWAKDRLYQYIDYRYANNKASLFTSNKHLDSIEERIADRIRGTCEQIEFKMSSKRKYSTQGGK